MLVFQQGDDFLQKFLPILKKCRLFDGLSEQNILRSLSVLNAQTITREKGNYILRAGERTECIGLVLSGTVMIIQEDLWGNRNIIAKLTAGDFFAEVFAATPHSVLNISAAAEEPCEILQLNIQRLLTSSGSEANNGIVRNLVAILADKTRMLNEKITHISKRKTRDKLLSYLSAESARQGSLSFDIPYNRQQLADYLCVERTAMSAELSKLQKEGLLKTRQRHFDLNRSAAQSAFTQPNHSG